MINKFRITLCIAALTLVPAHALAQAGDSAPTLAFKPANIARVRDLVAKDPQAAQRWEAFRTIAEAAVAKPPASGRQVVPSLEALALAYRVTGERRYAETARAMLMAQARKADWLTDMPLAARTPRWNSDLGMGGMAAAYGITYDAIRDMLTPGERRELVDGLVRGGIEPILNDWVDGRRRIHTLDTMGHNWWAHIVFSGGVGVLAILRDEPRAAEWARRIDAAGVEWLRFAGSRFEAKPPTFGDDGAYSETVGYADLGMHALLLFRRAWIEATGRAPTPIPGLEHVPDYFLATAYPRGEGWTSLNFGDSRPTACGCHALADLWALGDRNPAYLRYIAGFGGVAEKDAWREATNLPYFPDAAQRAAADAGTKTLPRSWSFASQGLATMRSSWQPDATMVAIKSGFTWNHNHADAGSFILQHRGKTLLADSGHSGYSTPQYDGYFRQSEAHNVVTIDGKAIPPTDTYDGSHSPGTVDHLIEAPGFRYVWADATGPTARNFQRNYRNLFWIGDTILILDDVRSWEIGQFEWLLHYNGDAVRKGQIVRIADGDAAVDVRPLFPQPFPDAGLPTDYPEAMRYIERKGLKELEPKSETPYLGFQPAGRSDREKFLVAIQPIEPGRTPSRIERLEGLNWIGVRITDGGKVTELYLNLLADGRIRHRNANMTLAGYETDAYLLGLVWDEGADRSKMPAGMFVANGSYVRRDGKLYLDSLSKLFAHFPLSGAGALALSAEPHANVRIACSGALTLAGSGAGSGKRLPCTHGFAERPGATDR